MTPLPPLIRPATAADQARINAIVRASRINPLGLKWERFLVAEADGVIIGVGQVKAHRYGSQELASIAVLPEYRKSGIATHLINRLLADHPGPIYLNCRHTLESFYERFGFRRLTWSEMPFDLKQTKVYLTLLAPLGWLISRGDFNILIMGRL